MEYRRFDNNIIARLDKDEEILTKIKEMALKENIKLASVSAIGAVNNFTVGLFNTNEKKYYLNNYNGDFEIVSLIGNITIMNDEVYTHIHGSFSNHQNKVFGGHLNEAVVSATCEIIINVIDGTVDRLFDDKIGLNLFKF